MKKIVLVALMALCSASFGDVELQTGGNANLILCGNCEKYCLDETTSLCNGNERCYEDVQKMREECKEKCENKCNSTK